MSDRSKKVQELFLAALEMPVEERDDWLIQQCRGDERLLGEVRALLRHDSPDDDPLEKGLDEALDGIPSTFTPDAAADAVLNESELAEVDSEHFISKLSEVGVLTADEIEALNRTFSSGESSASPRQIASQLVSQGKLTNYQASALLKGQPELLIDKYLILDLLDAGGMGMVFKAIHRPMNRTVAVKMIAQHLLASPAQVKRFQREVRVAATLEHPNIVRSYDADQSRGVHFLVMEYVRGQNLSKIVQQQGPMSVEAAVDCIRQAAKGLRYAQRKGVIHRDIKPGNLMLSDEGGVKVLDLGLANIDESFRLAQQGSIASEQDAPNAQPLAGSELTTGGTVLGTVAFMAPEQSLDARKADTRADIYSLGCTLYYLLIGETPYKGDTIFQVFMQHREGAIPGLREKRPDVPENVEMTCHKMLAKSPDDRYQSMAELLASIEDCDISLPPEKVSPNASERGATYPSPAVTLAAKPSPRNNPRKSGALFGWLVAATVLLAFGGYWWWQNNTNQDKQQVPVADTASANETKDVLDSHPIAAATSRYGLKFNGDGDWVELPHFGYDGKSPMTIEFWYRAPQIQDNLQSILSIDGLVWIEGFETNPGWRLRGRTDARVFSDAVAENTQITNKRIHVAIAFNGSTAEIFVDGKTQSVSLLQWDGELESRRPVDSLVFPIEYRLNSGESVIGGVYPANRGRKNFTGTIDEVRLSTSTRYTEDFTPRDRFEADEDTLALYHFEDGTGDVLTDSSGNDHHGKIVGAHWVRLDEEFQLVEENRALRFDGGKLNLPAFDWNKTSTLTWEVVFSCDHAPPRTQLTQDGSAGAVIRNGAGEDVPLGGRLPLQPGKKHHSALVVDGRQLKYFVNGKLAFSFEQPSIVQIEDLPIDIIDGLRGLYGTIDELRFSDIARYSEDFSPVDRFEPDAHTVALYHCDEEGDTLLDSSGNGYHVKIKESSAGNVSRVKTYDEANMSGADLLATDEFEWRIVEELPAPFSSGLHDAGADMTDDGLTIVFVSTSVGGKGNSDLWMSQRPSVDAPWGEPVNLGSAVNSSEKENSPSIDGKGRTLIFIRISERGAHRALISTRDTDDSPWSEPVALLGSSHHQIDITSDGLTLVVKKQNKVSGDLFLTSRPSARDPWRELKSMGEAINTDWQEHWGTMSDDGRLLLIQKYPGTKSPVDSDFYMSTRDGWSSNWSEPALVKSLNSPAKEARPRLLEDGKTLVFMSDRSGTRKLYLARLVRKPRKKPLSDDPVRLKEQAEEFVSLELCREAIKAYEKLWELPNADLNRKHSIMQDLYARTLQWEEALEHSNMRAGTKSWQYCALLNQTRRVEEHRAVRQLMLSNYRQVNSRHRQHMLLRVACLQPCDEGLFAATRWLVEKCLNSENPSWYFAAAGKGKYRLGEFQKWYETLPEDSLIRKNQDRTLLAIVAFQNDPSPENRRLLQDLIGRIENHLAGESESGYPLKYWWDFVEERAWLDEAKSVLDSVPAPKEEKATTATPSSADLLATGEYEWRLEGALASPINSPAWDNGADMTADELTIVFSSDRHTSPRQSDIWIAQRPSKDAPWSEPTKLGEAVNSDVGEIHASISDDALTLSFIRTSPQPLGFKWHYSTRETVDSPWTTARIIDQNVPGSMGFRAPRHFKDETSIQAFATEYAVADPSTAVDSDRRLRENTPTGSQDNRLKVFSIHGPGIVQDLWMSTRPDVDAEWSVPSRLATLSSDRRDHHPVLSSDGRRLIFASDRRGGSGSQDIYLARLVRKDSPNNKPLPTLDAYANGKWISILPTEGQMDYWNTWGPHDGIGGKYQGFQVDRPSDALIRGRVSKEAKSAELRLRISMQKDRHQWYAAKWVGNDRFQILKRSRDSVEKEPTTAVLAAIETGETYGEYIDLAFSTIGNTLALYVNGKLTLSAKDRAFAIGEPGFQIHEGKAHFKEMKVQILDIPQPSIGPLMGASKWAEAIEFGEKNISEKPSDSIRWKQVAPAYALADNPDAYREFCKRMLQQFDGDKNINTIERIIQAGLILPGNIAPYREMGNVLMDVVEETQTPNFFTPWQELSCALLAYRAGDFEQAITFAKQSNSHDPLSYVVVANHAILAMAYHHQKKTELAQQALELAAEAYEQSRNGFENLGDRHPHPHDFWLAKILYDEAQSVTESSGTKR